MQKLVVSILMGFIAVSSFSADNLLFKGNVHFTKENVKVFFDKAYLKELSDIDKVAFHHTDRQNLNFGFYSGRFWAKFKIDTILEFPQYLELKNPLLDDIQLFRKTGQEWVLQGRVGDLLKFSERKVNHRFPQFLINSTGEYLLRIETNGDLLALKMNLYSKPQIIKRDYRLQVFAGMYFGILSIVFLFNVFMFILLRGKRNLILIFFLLSMIFFELSLTGYGYEWFWGNSPFFQKIVIPWSAAISLLLIIKFANDYLKIKTLSPKTYFVLRLSTFLVWCNLLLSFLNIGSINVFIYNSNNIITLVLVFSVIPVAIAAVRNRIKSSRLVLISFIGLAAGALISSLHYFGLISNFFLENVNIQFGVLFQVVFLTFAVLDGYKIFKDKTNRNLREISRIKETQINKLEEQVLARKKELNKQKEELELVNREIISSITYANRIQAALIPDERTFLKDFKKGYLCFQPKEIVSGDFYWSGKVIDTNSKGDKVEKILVCVGDTNNHGVPGSILSVLALRVIQACIYKKSVSSPGLLLAEVNNEFNKLFPKLEENKEKIHGIYCTICVIDKLENTVEFAGARGRIFVRKSKQIIEYRGDERLLGKSEIEKPFRNESIQLGSNDIIYMGTDGYEKQFNFDLESKGKPIIELLNVYAPLSIEKQKAIYIKKYEELVARDGQQDDFCLIGIQL